MFGTRQDWIAQAQKTQKTQQKESNKDEEGEDQSPIKKVDTWDGTAESVSNWINNRTGFGLDISGISKHEVAQLLRQVESKTHKKVSATASQSSPAETADVWDAELATALLL